MPDVRRGASLALGLLFAINLLNFYDRQIPGAVAEPIRKEWGLSDSQIGLIGTAFTLLYAFVGVPLGRMADRFPRRILLSAGLFVWSALTAASGAAVGFWSLFVARLGVGVGEAACAPASSSLIGDLYEPSRRSRAMAIFMLGLPIGQMLSFAVSGWVAQNYGWRAAFYIAGLPGCALALLAGFLLVEPPRGAAEKVAVGAKRRAGSPYLLVMGIPTMWWIIASGALHNFNMYALALFLPSFLVRTHGLSVARAGLFSGLAKGVAGGAGLYLGGWLGDRLHRTRANGRLWLAALFTIAVVPLQLIALSGPAGSPYLFLAWLLPALLCMYTYYSTVYSSIHDIVEPALRGTAMALYFFAMYVMGASFGPWGTGVLSDSLAARAAGGGPMTEQFRAIGLHHALYAIPALEALLAVVLWASCRTVARDRARLENWMAQEAAR